MKNDGYSEMSIYKCCIKNTSLGGNHFSKEAVSECMKLSFHQTTSSYDLHLSNQGKRLEKT